MKIQFSSILSFVKHLRGEGESKRGEGVRRGAKYVFDVIVVCVLR